MILPNAHLAIVEERKVTGYLLNASHPDNGGKAQFFQTMGYSALEWALLVAALRQVAVLGRVVSQVHGRHGTKSIVDGQLPSQLGAGKDRAVPTVWIVELGDDLPRLVTVYPRTS